MVPHGVRTQYPQYTPQTVKPGRISRRRNLNSWKNKREETGERATGNKMDREAKRNRDNGREGESGTSQTLLDGYMRIMQINRNPGTTKRVSINSEMSSVKIQARREARCSSARTRANLD